MVETIDIPKGFFVFLEDPCTPKCGKSMKFNVFMWKVQNFQCFLHFHKNPGNMWFSACLRATPPKHQYSLRNINGFKHVMKPQNHGNRKNMKFHENHGFSCNLLKFHEIPWNSHFLCYMGASTPPWLKTLIFLRDYWWFRRHHRLENTESHVISAISWFSDFCRIFCFYHKNTSFTRILYFSVARPPQNTNIP